MSRVINYKSLVLQKTRATSTRTWTRFHNQGLSVKPSTCWQRC